MTNDELQAAIVYASQRLREVGTGELQYIEFNVHLDALLQEQRDRARKEPTL